MLSNGIWLQMLSNGIWLRNIYPASRTGAATQKPRI
jgi:hypothetical protein